MLRHLRARQCRRYRAGALPAPGPAHVLPSPQRAGDGACRGRLCADEEPARDAGVHDVDRAGSDEPRHRRRPRHREPPARAVAARRRLRLAPARSGLAATRGALARRRLRQRLAAARIALLRSDRAARAAHPGSAVGDARACEPGGDRSGDACLPSGRAGRGLRLSGGVSRAACLARDPAGARRGSAGRGGCADSQRDAPLDRGGRRRHLLGGDRRAPCIRRADRNPGRGDAGREGLAFV